MAQREENCKGRSSLVPRHPVARDDGAQLMLLAGIVLVSSFLLAIGVIGEISDLERTTVAELGDRTFSIDAWRELRVLVEDETRALVDASTSAEDFELKVLPQIAELYNLTLVDFNLNGVVMLNATGEAALHDGVAYDEWSHDGGWHFTDPVFGPNDGILQTSPCPAELGDENDCIIGVYLRFEVNERGHDLAESILFSLR